MEVQRPLDKKEKKAALHLTKYWKLQWKFIIRKKKICSTEFSLRKNWHKERLLKTFLLNNINLNYLKIYLCAWYLVGFLKMSTAWKHLKDQDTEYKLCFFFSSHTVNSKTHPTFQNSHWHLRVRDGLRLW